MKSLISLILFISYALMIIGQPLSTEVSSTNPDEIFQDSIDTYLSIIATGKHSSSLYANLGYSYYRINDLGNAILYYEKAVKIDPNNESITSSLSQIRAEIPIQITYIPDFILVRIYRSMYNYCSATTWSIMELVGGVILLILLYYWFFLARPVRPLIQWALISLLLLVICITSFFAYHRKQYELGEEAGISNQHQEIFQAPDDRSAAVLSIGPGNKVFILDSIGEWYKVQLRDKDTGWVRKSGIALI